MQDLVMSLSKASVRLALDGWDRDLELDFQDDNYTVLTGRNAGGKTLALKCLADFCEYLSEPTRYKFERLKKFFLQDGEEGRERILESLETQFEYEWMNHSGDSWGSLIDATSIKWFVMQNEDDRDGVVKIDLPTFASRLLLDEDSIGGYVPSITSSIVVQNRIRFVKGTGGHMSRSSHYVLEKRNGIRFNLSQRLNDGKGSIVSPDPEEIFEDWRVIEFPYEEEIHTFGPWDERGHKWMDEVESRLGIYFDREALVTASEETYDFHKTDKMLRFKISPVEWRAVSEAYNFTPIEKEEINEIVESWDDWYFEHMGRIFYDKFRDNLETISDPRSQTLDYELTMSSLFYFMQKICKCREKGTERKIGEKLHDVERPWSIKSMSCSGCGESLEVGPENRHKLLSFGLSGEMFSGLCDDEHQVKDDQHFRELSALRHTFSHFSEHDLRHLDSNLEVQGGNNSVEMYPELAHDWLESYNESEEEAVEEAYSFVPSPLTSRFTRAAIQGWPVFGLATAVRAYFDDKIPEYLSSGQSRLLSMFSRLAEYPEGSVLMIDEPELSLHIDWQEGLISQLIELFPHLKFIFATHSPNVIMEHTEKVLEVPPRDIA